MTPCSRLCVNLCVGTPNAIAVQQVSIIRNKEKWMIETKALKKMQKGFYDRRVLTENFNSLPFGFL